MLSRLKNAQKKPHPCKKRKDGPPNFKGKETSKAKSAASRDLQMRGDGSGVDAGSQTGWRVGLKKGLDIFLYGNVMFGHGEGGDHIGCV